MGRDVPSANTRRNEDVSPWKNAPERVEKKKAERPKPDMTIPVVVALYSKSTPVNYLIGRECNE